LAETNYKLFVLPKPLVVHTGISTAASNYSNTFHHCRSLLIFQKKFYKRAFYKNIFIETPKGIVVDFFFMFLKKPSVHSLISYLLTVKATIEGIFSGALARVRK